MLGDFNNAVEVKVKVAVDSTKLIELNTRDSLNALRKKIIGQEKTLILTIYSHSTVLFNMRVQHNQQLIPTNFVYKYFNPNNASITKPLNNKYGQQSFCYFTGHVDTDLETIVSLDLCNKVKGVIDYPIRTYSIKTLMANLQPRYFLSIQRNLETNNFSLTIPYLMSWILQEKLARRPNPTKKSSTMFSKRLARELKPSGGFGSKSYFIEMYVVLDHSLYMARDQSIEKTVEIGFKILNYAAALYKPLNIYLTAVGMEVWNNGNQINYNYSIDGEGLVIDSGRAVRELTAYRVKEVSPKISSDNIHLISNEDLDGALIGRGSNAGMCGIDSGGISLYEIDYTHTAFTLAHELAHSFDIPHVDIQFPKNTECLCDYGGNLSFENCIMNSRISKF